MKKVFYFVASLLILGCGSIKQTSDQTKTNNKSPKGPTTYAESITEKDLRDILYVYASDKFEGRNTGEKGQKMAIEYLKNFYINHAISAAQSDDNYFQKVPLQVSSLPTGLVTVKNENYQVGTDLITLSSVNPKTLSENEVVYAGYGVETDFYSDYRGIDVKGKIVLIKNGEPKKNDGTNVISGNDQTSPWGELRSGFSKKLELAKSKGAKAIFYYAPDAFGQLAMQYLFIKNRASKEITLKESSEENNFSYFFINEKLATGLIENINTLDVAKKLGIPISFHLESEETKNIDSENVIAFIKGSEKPEEYVVISAHLDHLGMGENGEVYNGADDDGSGTTAVLEIAEAFKKAYDEGNGPKRSVVFLHVTGEEKGLLGSEYYSEHPIFPMENTVVDLNIDMVGRIDPKYEGNRNYIYLIGADKLSTDLHNLSEAVNNKYTHIELDYRYNDENDPNRFYYRSDHYNFAKHNVPIIFYFNGTHDDYHQVTDTPDKINYDLLANRAKLVFYTAWEIANRDERLVVDKAAQE
ncbi:hypothetical protein NBRC110019_10360 [Neptunitalea chrysea]|uniref:Peptidase M28 domain-containing protein n=1 Tax=Neptunitalea chrysea TaxID=1647581 RepID=A0A9W6EV18_9FLAO|nr:M28 family peptidase [Neptunitalea chrysea]GLB51997.1 hypothetical protein NBRC110019_10360 [Neptunitalea chrysea]